MQVPFAELNREWFYFESDFLKAFTDFGREGYYVLGPKTENFESNFATYHGYKYGVSVSTGLAALEISLLASGVKAGDEVITVSNSAVATSLAISNIGATPVFCDIKDNYLIDEEQIESLINTKTKVILPVHLFGQVCNMTVINSIAAKHNLIVIEDACQAHGANFKGDAAINTKAFSFYPTKNLGALGEGGLVMTNDEKVRDYAVSYRNYGQQGRYNHVIKGNNYRADALQCVLLDIKLKKLKDFIERRRDISQKYMNELNGVSDLILPEFSEDTSCHLFVVRILNGKRDALRDYLKEQGIETLVHYPATINKQPCYREEYKDIILEKTDSFQSEILSLPCYPFLKDEEQDFVIAEIKKYLS